MQDFNKISTKGTFYTAAQVQGFLQQQVLQEQWVVDHLNEKKEYIEDLTPFVDLGSAEIQHDTQAGIKRTLKMTVRGDRPIKYLSHCIRPHYLFSAPDGGFIDFALGIFPISPSETDIYPLGSWQKIQCTDFLQLLVDSTFDNAFTVAAGSSYVNAINSIVQSYGGVTPLSILIPSPGIVTPSSWTWNMGENRLTAINDLLAAINYFPLWSDENGIFRSFAIPDYRTVQPAFVFDTTKGNSIVGIPIKKSPNYAKIFNRCTVIVEDPRQARYSVTYENTDQGSPVSIKNWHPKTKVIRKANINTAQALQIARYNVQYAAMLYNQTEIDTLPWPTSQDNDVYGLIYNSPDTGAVNANFVEIGWTHSMKKGASTKHSMIQVSGA